ncbi:MAG: hypothetical protein VXW65_02385 [Pseudomonadota bacterium]|nr:hypothetical protein [Pseudomonadota bacterium]
MKLYGFIVIVAICLFLVSLVVIMTRVPRTRPEWVVSLSCTVVGSLTGGAFVVQRFGLHAWANDWFGMVALGGVVFACGLPAWAIVRWTFNYINAREGAGIIEVIREIKDEVRK